MDATDKTTQAMLTNMDNGESPKRMKIDTNNDNPWDRLDDVIAERLLAQLPVADIFRSQFVCKRWYNLIHSPTFPNSSHEVLNQRSPWFLMFDTKSPADVVYDMEVEGWRHVHLPIPKDNKGRVRTPVAASGGLMCFKSRSNKLFVCNPLTGSTRLLPRLGTGCHVKVIAMHTFESSYKVFVVFKKFYSLWIKVFSSEDNSWIEFPVKEKSKVANLADVENNPNLDNIPEEIGLQGIPIWWISMKKRAGLTTIHDDGRVLVYYRSHSGRLVCCDIDQGTILLYPHVLPRETEYAIDLVECGGRVLAVVLVEEFETATLTIREFSDKVLQWTIVTTMPPNMSQNYYGREVDVNCAGYGNYILMCMTSEVDDLNQVVMYNITEDSWVELPRCSEGGDQRVKRLALAYSFMPDIEAKA